MQLSLKVTSTTPIFWCLIEDCISSRWEQRLTEMLLVIAAIPYIEKSQWISIPMWRWMLNLSMFFNWYMCCQVLFFLKFIVFFNVHSWFSACLASKVISIELTAKWRHGIHLDWYISYSSHWQDECRRQEMEYRSTFFLSIWWWYCFSWSCKFSWSFCCDLF